MPSWTPEQRAAIEARGGTVLVSAAAGSGKTAVLTERVIGLLCDSRQPVDADRLLIATFSRAAAAEMRGRIAARLSEMIRGEPSNIYLQRQQALLGSASIVTVHAFCSQLIRENFQHVAVAPDFEIMDEAELNILMDDAAAEVIEQAYGEADPVFFELVELLSTGRDDSRLRDAIYRIYGFARSHPFPERWLESRLRMYDPTIPVEQSLWGRALLRHAESTLAYCVQSLEGAADLATGDERMEKAYLPAFSSDLRQAKAALEAVRAGRWDESVFLMKDFEFARLGAVRGDDPAKTAAKEARDRCKDLLQKLAKDCLCAAAAEYQEDIEDLRPKIRLLFGLVGSFSEKLLELKAAKKKLDYADLEHLALSLLIRRDADGAYIRTEHASRIAERYDYVLVDEYQDTNEVQDLIFSSVSRGMRNLFMVGDVKQSIYGFRQAMPEIFLAKKRDYFPYDGTSWPASIMLDKNFRSRACVTGAVNYLFGLLMSRGMGGLDYDEAESLKCGASYPDYEPANPEFLLLSPDGDEEEATEADAVARRICALLESGYKVADGGAMRAVQPRDICILMRSPRGRAQDYARALGNAGVAAVASGASGFLTSREVAGAVGMLRALLNPLLDTELLAAMLSPLFDFTDDDAASIRLRLRSGPFYLAVLKAAELGNEKCAAFLETFSALRGFSAVLSAHELIRRLYAVTGVLEAVSAMPMGEGRRANLLMLVSHAAAFHNAGYKGLARFVGLLDRLAEQGGDLAPGSPGETANAVRIMSVHKSKGLEFPVVILADTARRFNLSDLRENTLLHSEYGFACRRRDKKLRLAYATLPMAAIRLAIRETQLSEEMRVLYVALTRAREKLIITAAPKRPRLAPAPLSGGRLPAFTVASGNCWADWLIAALLHHPDAAALREAGGVIGAETIPDGTRWEIALPSPASGKNAGIEIAEASRSAMPDQALIGEVNRRMSWAYPHPARTLTPVKLAVSDAAAGEVNREYRFARRPRFLAGYAGALTPAEKGSAMHKFMQFADYENARDHLEDEIARMRDNAFLTPAETESLSRQSLRKFFQGPLGKRMFQSARLLREVRFMAEFGQDKLVAALPQMDENSRVVLQGVADAVFFEHGAAVVVDYKTDRVDSMEQLLERYRVQLELYRDILSESLDAPVKSAVLYSFALSDWIEWQA